MIKKFSKVALCLACVFALGACAEFKSSGKAIGHAAKDISRSVGHGFRDAAKAVGKDTKKFVQGDKQNNRKGDK